MTKIAYIGNFGPSRSTENAYRYGFEQHGIPVAQIPQQLAQAHGPAGFTGLEAGDVVLYTRTHNGTALGPEWTRAWRNYEAEGIRTASVHLDVFVGVSRHGMIPDRWDDPLFTTGTVFTPDPALAEKVNTDVTEHVWLPPAADIRAGDQAGFPIHGLTDKIVFVGSRYGTHDVHPEYPFRTQLLDWLEGTYGLDFYRYGGGSPFGTQRGKPLWDIYTSGAVIIGDSCFAGERPYYWSDRIPETLAHGGLLLHPDVDGLDLSHPYVWLWEKGDGWQDRLAGEIARARNLYRETRDRIREAAIAHTRDGHTYVDRAAAILTELGVPYGDENRP